MRRFLMIAGLYLGVLAVAYLAVWGGTNRPSNPVAAPSDPESPPAPDDIVLTAALTPFDGCDDLLEYFKREGLERVGPYGLGGTMMYGAESSVGGVAVDADASTLSSGGAGAAGSAGAPAAVPQRAAEAGAAPAADGASFSGTNVQEKGVDEPDVVKSDGRRLVTLNDGSLNVFEISRNSVRRVSTLQIEGGWGSELLLVGDRVLVLGHGQHAGIPEPLPAPADDARIGIMPSMGAPVSQFAVVDISDATEPVVTSTLRLDGGYVSARLVDGVARVVVRSDPVALPFVQPQAGGLRAEREATAKNRGVIEASKIEDWLPYAVADTPDGEEQERALVDCSDVHHPQKFAGFGMVSVVSIDVSDDLDAAGAAAVVGAADTVYASQENLYVALHEWQDPSGEFSGVVNATTLHQFDITDPQRAAYVASGGVKGHLLNQWALSEHNGYLRVATTQDDPTGAGASVSSVVVLQRADDTLKAVGRVGGLGKTERIYSVRYDGDIGYVVTFRQTDPLYTLDLSDPTDPQVRGELKINGYSAYLHPVGDGRVLGVGQDATDDGQVTGSQVSLFDVSDLESPRRLDQLNLGQGSSSVEYDHRAFLFWAKTGTAVVPLQTWTRKPFNGAVVLDVQDQSVRRKGTLEHRAAGQDGIKGGGDSSGVEPAPDVIMPSGATIGRTFVLDDALVSISDAGVMVSGLDDLKTRASARFDQ